VSGTSSRSDSTFRLLPGQDRIKVSVVITLTNRKPPSTRIGPCPGGMCRITTNYYMNQWGYVWVPAGASNVRFSSPGLGTRVEERDRHWVHYMLSFPNLTYGQTRRIALSYELLGGKPRSQHRTRVMDAYTYFCWQGELGDRGTVTAVLPPGYEATTFWEKTRTKSTRKGTTISGLLKGSPARFYACTDAYKPEKLLRTELTSPAGGTVTVEGWPEDPDWSEQTTAAIEDALPDLEELLGRPLPFDELVVREVSQQSLYGYGIEFGARSALIRLGEHSDDPTSAPRGLASAWINNRKIADPWLDIGLTDWAGLKVTRSQCWPAGEYPAKDKPRLARWQQLKEKPSDRLEAIVDWQDDAACNVIDHVADDIGSERMQAVIASLLDGTPKYGPQPAERQGAFRRATWKDWLDAADELGLVPAGVTDLKLAERDLLAVGAATARQLRGRAEARTAYHAALAEMDGTAMPMVVNDLMGRWQFREAMASIPVAADSYAAISANERMSEADRALFLERFAAAASVKALKALAREAAAFVSSAPDGIEPPPAEGEDAGRPGASPAPSGTGEGHA
jgi:hypothetical protein